jgi:phosphohistidine phosphatase
MTEDRTLYVLRHAKSSWDDPMQSDHDRPLAPRGRRATKLLAQYVSEHAIAPQLVLCSTARRARETLEGIGFQAGQQLLEPELYSAGPDELIARLAQVDPQLRSVLLVGHNPALQMLILRLAAPDDRLQSGALDDVRRKFPTGALATLTFGCGWDQLQPGAAELAGYIRPKALQYQ